MADQIDIFDVIDDIDRELAGYPVRIDAWRKRPPSDLLSGPLDIEGAYVLHVTADAREYLRVTIACPEGWTVARNDVGVFLLDGAGVEHLCHVAIKSGLVKVAASSPFPDRAMSRQSFERWGGK